jgi:hypothetical protein
MLDPIFSDDAEPVEVAELVEMLERQRQMLEMLERQRQTIEEMAEVLVGLGFDPVDFMAEAEL